MWILFAAISTLSSATRRIYDKNLTTHFSNFALAFALNAFSLLPTTILLFFFPMPADVLHLSWQFWWPTLLSCIVQYPLQIYFYLRAIREGELSSVLPLMTLTPVFNVFTSLLLIHEIPTVLGICGIAFVALGTYLLLKKKGTRVKSRPELFMALSMLCLAFGATFDKIAIGASTAIFYVFVNTVISGIVLFICMHFSKQRHEVKIMETMPKRLMFVGLLVTISYATLELAFASGPTAYVLAIRTGSFMLASIWGLIKLKESISPRKLLAIGCFLAGALILAFA